LHIAETFAAWREEDKFSRIASRDEIVKNDYNISPSRYIHTGDAEEYRPIAEIVDELRELESEIADTDIALKKIIASLGI
jgi:type I restriction enzyme M protein